MIDQQSILEVAIKNEKDRKIKERLKAVRFVLVSGYSIDDATEAYCVTAQCIKNWVQWYKDDGINGLRDLPRNGRPASIPMEKLSEFIVKLTNQVNLTPQILQEEIHKRFGRHFHITYIRKIMHRFNLSCKRPTLVHINRASPNAVRSWQNRIQNRLIRLKSMGYTIVIIDQSFFVHDVIAGRKYWTWRGSRSYMPYTGNHKSVAVFGGGTTDGRQIFRLYPKFNSETFQLYMTELHQRFGKVAIMLDRAPAHRSNNTKEFIKKQNGTIKLLYIPKGSPYLSVVEEYWHMAKHDLLVSEYYRTFDDMRDAISAYFRTHRFGFDVMTFLMRKLPPMPKDL